MQKEKKVILAFHHSTRYTYTLKKKKNDRESLENPQRVTLRNPCHHSSSEEKK